MSAHRFRAGDTVHHHPTGETWLLAYAHGDHVSWYGWPEGEAFAADCTLVRAATDAKHEAALREWAERPRYRDHGGIDRRCAVCMSQLEDLLEQRGDFSRIRPVTTVRFERAGGEA